MKWLVWPLMIAALPGACASSYGALSFQSLCLDEGYAIPGCDRSIENIFWLLALGLIIGFGWAADKILKRAEDPPPTEPHDNH